RDQLGLRLRDFRAVDLEQRIAALDVLPDLRQQAGDASRERRQYAGAGILVERDLPNGLLHRLEIAGLDRNELQLVHLFRADADTVGVLGRGRCGRRRGRGLPAGNLENHESDKGAYGKDDAGALQEREWSADLLAHFYPECRVRAPDLEDRTPIIHRFSL